MTGRRKPFTLRERRAFSQDFGHRPRSAWGGGDLPAPFCAGDVVELVGEMSDESDGHPRLRGMTGPFFVVSYACSIGEDDEWYFRVDDGDTGSDRLHVIPTMDIDWMAPFRLVETVDPDGLAERERLLAAGWSYTPPELCPTCGHETTRGAVTIGDAGADDDTHNQAGQTDPARRSG